MCVCVCVCVCVCDLNSDIFFGGFHVIKNILNAPKVLPPEFCYVLRKDHWRMLVGWMLEVDPSH